MNFNINRNVIKMLELIANRKELQTLIRQGMWLLILWKALPALIDSIRWW